MAVGVAADRVDAQVRGRAAHRHSAVAAGIGSTGSSERAEQTPARWCAISSREHGRARSRRAASRRSGARTRRGPSTCGARRREAPERARRVGVAGRERAERVGDRAQPEDAGPALAGALARPGTSAMRAVSRRPQLAVREHGDAHGRRVRRRAAAGRPPRAVRRAPRRPAPRCRSSRRSGPPGAARRRRRSASSSGPQRRAGRELGDAVARRRRRPG